MRIAFVSYEYAGVALGGGIGTYIRQTASMLAARGHEVVVFTSNGAETADDLERVFVKSISASPKEFSQFVAPVFLKSHQDAAFDVVESAEYGADIEGIIKLAPEVPRVVKLHTATYQIGEFNLAYLGLTAKTRFIAGALRRGCLPKPFWGKYNASDDPERRITLAADEVTSPSRALLNYTAGSWPLDMTRASVIPHVFDPDPSLIEMDPARQVERVTFIGKLEVRKGVLELARAIPAIVEACPAAQFRFVGRSLPHPATGEPLDDMMRRLAGPAVADRLEFTGGAPYSKIPEFLADTAVCVFPSYWEAFGFVCLEAMAAGCAVVGSAAGGMAEIIENGRSGLLVPPRKPRLIAKAVIALLKDVPRRTDLGHAAREHVLTAYAPESIAPLQEASYARAIARAKVRGSLNK